MKDREDLFSEEVEGIDKFDNIPNNIIHFLGWKYDCYDIIKPK
jgi:hypothetical protein